MKLKSVFDATPYRTAATPESSLLQNTLLDTELTDATNSSNLVLAEDGKFIDQGTIQCKYVNCAFYTPLVLVFFQLLGRSILFFRRLFIILCILCYPQGRRWAT